MKSIEVNAVSQYKSDVAFKTLIEQINENVYFIPKYQRKFRWSKEQVQELARSLVKGYPIPPIYAYRNQAGQLEILDGQQRLMSFYFYYIGKFYNKSKVSAIDFRYMDVGNKSYYDVLKECYELVDMTTYLDIEGDRQDISYQSLPLDLKRKIDFVTITVIELRWENLNDRAADLRKIFKVINSKGEILSDQEIRNGIYDCPFYDMLRDLNRQNNDWKWIRGMEKSKEEDMEILLRLCTIYKNVLYEHGNFTINNYHGKYSVWLDEFSEYARRMDEKEIVHYQKMLEDFFSHFRVTKEKRIELKKRVLLESLFVVIEKTSLDMYIEDDVIDLILSSNDYKSNSIHGTVKKSAMNERWKGAYAVLSKYSQGDSGIITE